MRRKEQMKTNIISINPDTPEKKKIRQAASVIKNGGLVAFPTDTVYGLGADASNEKAVLKIYKVKGRDKSKPLSTSRRVYSVIYDF